MADLIRPTRPMDEVGQAVYHNSRERRRARLDPAFEMKRTAHLTSDPVAASFPEAVRLAPVTVAFDLLVTGSTSGVVFAIGNTVPANGFGATVSGSDITFSAGRVTSNPSHRIDVTLTDGVPARVNPWSFVVSVNPGTGEIRVWRDGRELGRARASAGDFGAAGTWCDSGAGILADSLVNCSVGPLSVYARQRPPQFDSEA